MTAVPASGGRLAREPRWGLGGLTQCLQKIAGPGLQLVYSTCSQLVLQFSSFNIVLFFSQSGGGGVRGCGIRMLSESNNLKKKKCLEAEYFLRSCSSRTRPISPPHPYPSSDNSLSLSRKPPVADRPHHPFHYSVHQDSSV